MAESTRNAELSDGDEAKKMPSLVVEEIQKLEESAPLQPPVSPGLLQRWCFPKDRRGKIIFWLFVVAFTVMLLIVILLATILGLRAHAKPTSHASSTHTHAPTTSAYASPASTQTGVTCTVKPAASGKDSSANIQKAFESCGQAKAGLRNRIVFQNTTYTIASVLETTGLKNVDIELHGTLSWDNSDISYWLNNSLPVGYQNQSTAWRLGGDGITFRGNGSGTFNGNGDVWYKFINGRSNYPGRPHQLTITETTNSTFEGLIFLQSQMWTMTVIHSADVLLQDIYVNNTSKTGAPTVNTDGCDTIYANNITFRRWIVDNGDDAISPKANSTNILIEDSKFYRGSGIALGSIGQLDGQFETIENVTCRNITSHNTKNGALPQMDRSGQGSSAKWRWWWLRLCAESHLRGLQALQVTQCTNFEGNQGDCDTSKFNIHDVFLSNFTGTVQGDIAMTMQCSAAAPCHNIQLSNVVLENSLNNTTPRQYQCDSVKQTVGFNCTGPPDGEDNAFKR